MSQLLPVDAQCVAVVKELLEWSVLHPGDIDAWTIDFCKSNSTRTWFSDKQKEVIKQFAKRYVLKSLK